MLVKFISIWFPVLILASMSLLILHSVEPEIAKNQAIFMGFGLLIMIVVSKIDYHFYLFSPWPWFILAVVLLMLTMVVGTTVRGSTRWLDFGPVRLQTSEMVKPLILLYLSTWLAQSPPLQFLDLLKKITLTLLPAGLIFIEPDLGTAMVIMAMFIFLVIAAGTPFKYLLILATAFTLSLPIGYAQLRQYQKDRIASFLNPNRDPLGTGYNASQAMIAVGSGMIFGRGLGQGTQSHLRFLPERHTDFIFAATVEELGYLGGMLLLAAYGWLVAGLLQIARTADTDSGSLIILGTIGLIITQVTVNTGMNMGILPITGITLPFVSAGGSSVLSLCMLLGLCISVGNTRRSHRPTLEIK